MNTTRQFLKALAGLLLLTTTLNAHAIPSLTFDGTVSYDAGTSTLSVISRLTSSSEIVPSPTLLGSSLTFSALLDSSYTDGVFTYGLFSGVAGDDLTVSDGTPTTLLTGEFLDLTMFGINASLSPGQNSATLSGSLSATGGSLAGIFSVSNLIAIQLNLSTTIDPDMFDADYSGNVDGRIEQASRVPVPEPITIALLGLGLLLLGIARFRSNTCNRK